MLDQEFVIYLLESIITKTGTDQNPAGTDQNPPGTQQNPAVKPVNLAGTDQEPQQ